MLALITALVIAAAPAPAATVSALPPLGGTVAPGAPVLSVAAGQTAHVALVVRAPETAKVTISLDGDLKSPKSRIAAGRIAIRPVEQWAPYGPTTGAGPAVEGTGMAARRVYWLRASVPRGQPAGRYRGVVRVSAAVPGRAAALRGETTVDLEVLPFDLIGASRQYVWIGSAAWQQPEGLLARLRESGFHTAGVTAPVEELWPALEQCRAQAARGSVPYRLAAAEESPPVEEIEAARREKLLPPLLWIFSGEQTAEAVRLGRAGISVGALLAPGDPLPEPPVDTLIRRVEKADVAAYLKTPIAAMASPRPGEPPARRLVQWWSWDTRAATPAQNRLYAGFLLWRAGFTGACVEQQEEDTGDLGGLARRWEAVRWGVDDVRYLTTYYGLLRQLRDKNRRHPLPDKAEAEVAAVLARLTPDSPLTSADHARRTLVRWITALKSAVG